MNLVVFPIRKSGYNDLVRIWYDFVNAQRETKGCTRLVALNANYGLAV